METDDEDLRRLGVTATVRLSTTALRSATAFHSAVVCTYGDGLQAV
jgi:hypothetical protein